MSLLQFILGHHQQGLTMVPAPRTPITTHRGPDEKFLVLAKEQAHSKTWTVAGLICLDGIDMLKGGLSLVATGLLLSGTRQWKHMLSAPTPPLIQSREKRAILDSIALHNSFVNSEVEKLPSSRHCAFWLIASQAGLLLKRRVIAYLSTSANTFN